MAFLEIENINKSFGKVEVLKGINLEINKGEVLSIIGSSGSGKTTLLRCINFLEKPDNGVMVLDGQPLFDSASTEKESESSLREKRLNFGLVFQSFNLFPQYNVLKNITLAPKMLLNDKVKDKKKELTASGVKGQLKAKKQELIESGVKGKQLKEQLKAKKQELIESGVNDGQLKEQLKAFKSENLAQIDQKAQKLLEKIGLSEKVNAYPCELSGGQSQRVAIARALMLEPKVLCFDEPTSALDPELTGEVLRVIRSLKDEDRTMIIVTHEMGFAKNVSDKVVFMANGIIEEEGTPSEIFDNPKSEKLKNFLSNVESKEGI